MDVVEDVEGGWRRCRMWMEDVVGKMEEEGV